MAEGNDIDVMRCVVDQRQFDDMTNCCTRSIDTPYPEDRCTLQYLPARVDRRHSGHSSVLIQYTYTKAMLVHTGVVCCSRVGPAAIRPRSSVLAAYH